MLRFLPAFALLLTPFAVHAQAEAEAGVQEAPLSLDHRMMLRCAATAALVARGQETGDPAMADYPDLRVRGREFFVRASVRVMDEAGLARETVERHLREEAGDIVRAASVHEMMPLCLTIIPQQV